MLSVGTAVLYSLAGGAVVFLCRAFPFIFLAGGKNPLARQRIFVFAAEKVVPPLAITLLCANAIISPVRQTPALLAPVIASSVFTAALHLWRRNVFISIVGGTALYMALIRII